MTRSNRILIVDDNEDVLISLELLLKQRWKSIVTEKDPTQIPKHFEEGPFELILLDMNYTRDTTSGAEGFQWLERILKLDPAARVIVITGYGDVDMAVRAIKEGASDFVLKPWDNEKLLKTLESVVRKPSLVRPPATPAQAADADGARRDQLQFAREVQGRLFPQSPPTLRTLEYCGVCKTAYETGGDYYDFIRLDGDLLGMALGDVSGKGVSAALLMASLQGRLQSFAPLKNDRVAELVGSLNESMCTSTDTRNYITFFYAVYDDHRRRLTYSNAGHLPPLVISVDGTIRRLSTGATVLGLFPRISYPQETIQLEPGETFVLFTDGVTEAMNPAEEEFGDVRLVDFMLTRKSLKPLDLQNDLLQELERFSSGHPQHDDLTVVIGRVI